MNWYSGDIGQCIKEVKVAKKLLLVFSKDDGDASNASYAALNAEDVVVHCQNIVCLQLKSGSVPYHQFESVYEVPSLPCIHIISPSGLVLGVKTKDFSVNQISSWITENIVSFEKAEGKMDEIREVQGLEPDASSLKVCGPASPPLSCPRANANPTAGDGHAFLQLEEKEVPQSSKEQSSTVLSKVDVTTLPPRPDSSLNDHSDSGHPQAQDENPEDPLEADAPVLPHRSGNNLNERIERARHLLETKRQEKAVRDFQEAQESELKRRDLGRDMVGYKRRKQEQEIRERLEEQKREKAEKQATRQRILAQIELDRLDRLGHSAPKAPTSKPISTPVSAVDPNEVRLQLRLPDGSHMVGAFAADARLGSEVRQYISSRVLGTDNEAVAPLSDAVRASFAPVLASGFTFRQTCPNPPRHFSPEDETTKTLRELDLWPSAVLILHNDKYKPTTGYAIAGPPQNVLPRVMGLIWEGIHGIGGAFFYLGNSLIQLGRSAWQILLGVGTVGQAQASNSVAPLHSPPRNNGEQLEGKSVYRRQGKISRLSHMPDDTDEQARWNGNSTTQL